MESRKRAISCDLMARSMTGRWRFVYQPRATRLLKWLCKPLLEAMLRGLQITARSVHPSYSQQCGTTTLQERAKI